MNKAIFLLLPALLAFYQVRSSAQELNSWGRVFDCAVDWFGRCRLPNVTRERETANPREMPAGLPKASSLSQGTQTTNLPVPVRNVLENPSPETARAYVLWSRERSEKLAQASEYIAQATREISSEVSSNERNNNLPLAGVGPVGLYYFFSPGDPSTARDVAVLNKIWSEGRIGVVGIPVRGNDEEVVNFVNEAKPLFPIRRSEAEVRLVKPTETPDLYLALPLEKKIFRLGSTITETAITHAMSKIVTDLSRGRSTLGLPAPDR